MIQEMTHGNPLKLIVRFAIPLLIGNMVQQLYHISDIIIVGRLISVNALAAVGASAPVYFVFLLVAFGFTGGLTVVTAQRFGARDHAGVRRSVTHCIMASTGLSLIFVLLQVLFLRKLLHIMNVPADIFEDAYKFTHAMSLGFIIIVAYNLLSGFIRALGDSKTPLYFLIFSSLLNIIFNIFFIYVLKMGVVGSALGTITAMSVAVICCIIYIRKKFPILHLRKEDWKFDSQFMKQHLNIAIPMALQFSVLSLGLLVMQSVCNSFGPNTIAAFTSAFRIEQFATQPLTAIGLTLSTYAAQNYGAGMISRIRQGVFVSTIISLSLSVVIALLVRFVGENMVQFVVKDANEEILSISKNYLNISTLFYSFLGMIFVFRNTLQGMGKSMIPLMAGFAELFMRSFAAIYLASHMGYMGICYASPIAWLGAGLVVIIGYIITIRRINRQFFRNRLKSIKYHLGLSKPQTAEVEMMPAE